MKQLHWPQISRLKLSQADPRMWRALVMSFAPSRVSAKSFSQKAIEASWSSSPSPCASKASSVVSTMKVDVLAIELVDVGLKPAVLRLAEVESERVERLGDAEPDVAIGADEKIGPELIGVSVTDLRIETIGRHDEIGVREFDVGINLALERELDAKRLATSLQDVQELLAADADKAVTASCAAANP